MAFYNEITIDPQFAKPKNLIGLTDPEEGITSNGGGGSAVGTPIKNPGTPATPPGGSENPNNTDSKIILPPFSVVEQKLVLDGFQNYSVDATVQIEDESSNFTYEVRVSSL